MQNSERWDFAQSMPIEMMKQGGGLTISAVLGYLYYPLQKIIAFGFSFNDCNCYYFNISS
jgi:hypothetical protein